MNIKVRKVEFVMQKIEEDHWQCFENLREIGKDFGII